MEPVSATASETRQSTKLGDSFPVNLDTDLKGRLQNTHLPLTSGLLPMFEAVVNSIQSIQQSKPDGERGTIIVNVNRDPRPRLFDPPKKPGAPPTENIYGFSVADDGAGFNDDNMHSFRMLDSQHKAALQCRGVGRLLWLKAFDMAEVTSIFRDAGGSFKKRTFKFSSDGVQIQPLENCDEGAGPSSCTVSVNPTA